MGNIFQIVDDSLDYFSAADKVGKNTGDDFFEGKITLPLIFLLDKLNTKEKEKLEKMLKSKKRNELDFKYTIELMEQYAIKSDIAKYLEKLESKAQDALSFISISDKNECKKYMQGLIEFAISRSY